MKCKLRILTLVLLGLFAGRKCCFAQPPIPAAEPRTPAKKATSPASGQRLVEKAAATLSSEPSFEAKIRQRVRLFGRQMVGTGVYRQQRAGDKRMARLELKLQLDEEITSVQHISNGRFLWIRRDLPGDRGLSRIDLDAVQEAMAEKAGQGRGQRDAKPPITLGTAMAMGGLPDLIAGIAERFHFAAPRPGSIQTVPVWILDGRWRPEMLAELIPKHRDAILAGQTLTAEQFPPQLPSEVTLVLSRDPAWPMFPYRVEYRRLSPTKNDPRQTKTILTMEFFEVRRGVRFHPDEFQYELGDQDIDDDTQGFITRLKKNTVRR